MSLKEKDISNIDLPNGVKIKAAYGAEKGKVLLINRMEINPINIKRR